MRRWLIVGAGMLLALQGASAPAQDVIDTKRMTMDLARDIAAAAVEACRERGYQVTAVVVDYHGSAQVMMRDTLAPRFTRQIAREKANAVVLSGVSSGAFRANRADIRAEMNHLDGIVVLRGGLAIEAAGQMLGAVGVSGAPGGDEDEACARAGIDAVRDRLEFVEP